MLVFEFGEISLLGLVGANHGDLVLGEASFDQAADGAPGVVDRVENADFQRPGLK